MTMLLKEIETYEQKKSELLKTDKDNFVLIKGEVIVSIRHSREDALKDGYERFGNAPFLVKKIVPIETPLNFTSCLIGE